MDKRSFTLLSCIGSLFVSMSIQLKTLIVIAQSSERDSFSQQTLPSMSPKQLCNLAESITVKIMLSDGSARGSGFLVSKAGTVYTIVTNQHVLTNAKQYKIKTRDGNYYIATRVPFDSSDDLALLSFQAQSGKYEVAKPESGLKLDSKKGDRVIAAGFAKKKLASESVDFVCTPPGNVYRVLKKPMESGYQIGYFLNIQKGMSGGPLLNSQGRVVGVNGKSRPLWGGRSTKELSELFLYQNDCSSVLDSLSLEEQKLIIKSSWAIPIDTVETQVRQARLPGINFTVIQPPQPAPTSEPGEVVGNTNQVSTTPQTHPPSPTSEPSEVVGNTNQASPTTQPPPTSPTSKPRNVVGNTNQASPTTQPPPTSPTSKPRNVVGNTNQASPTTQPPPTSPTSEPSEVVGNTNQASPTTQPPPTSPTSKPRNVVGNTNQASPTPQPPPTSPTSKPRNVVGNTNQASPTTQPPPTSPTSEPSEVVGNTNQASPTTQPPPTSPTSKPRNVVGNTNQASPTPQPPPTSPTSKPEGTKAVCPRVL